MKVVIMGLFGSSIAFTFEYEKNGVKDKIVIKAKDYIAARDKFNHKVGFCYILRVVNNTTNEEIPEDKL